MWRCSHISSPETPPGTEEPAATVQRSNCTGALIISSSEEVVKIPWQEEKYPSFPHSLKDIKGARIKNTLVVCGTSLGQDFERVVLCFKGTLPNFSVFWNELTELKNFKSVPMLSSKESDEKIWAVGGYFGSDGDSSHVQTINLVTGEVTLLSDMALNKNISGGCTVMVDDKFLYIIGGEGFHEGEDFLQTADVTRNISMLNTETGKWKTDLPRMKITRIGPQCLETTIDGNRGKNLSSMTPG